MSTTPFVYTSVHSWHIMNVNSIMAGWHYWHTNIIHATNHACLQLNQLMNSYSFDYACYTTCRCVFEDHGDHAHCWINFEYTASLIIAESSSGGASETTADAASHTLFSEEAVTAQWECMPHTRHIDYYSAVPAPLSREQCVAMGSPLVLEEGLLYRVWARMQLGDALGDDGMALELLSADSSRLNTTPTSTTPAEAAAPPDYPKAMPPSSSPKEQQQQQPAASPPKMQAWSVSMPACNMVSRTQCSPTLSTVASIAATIGMGDSIIPQRVVNGLSVTGRWEMMNYY